MNSESEIILLHKMREHRIIRNIKVVLCRMRLHVLIVKYILLCNYTKQLGTYRNINNSYLKCNLQNIEIYMTV